MAELSAGVVGPTNYLVRLVAAVGFPGAVERLAFRAHGKRLT